MTRLNIGSGGRKLEGYVNVDLQPEETPDVLCDIGRERWPFADSSVDEVVAAHVLEHLTTPEFMHCMKETYRVCKDGAKVQVKLPHPRHDLFLGDPTHQRPILPATLLMFSKGQLEQLRAQGKILTPFWKYLGVDFYLESRVKYLFDEGVDANDPELAWKMKHLNNIIMEFECTMRVVKP